MEKLLIFNIGLLATPLGCAARGGREQGSLALSHDAWVLVEDGSIAATGVGSAPSVSGAQMLDAGHRLVTPGLVDAHTHLIFGGWRQNELGQKLHGAGYLDILASGGGILSTMRATREASEDALFEKANAALDEMLRLGTTTVEAKSGYGLNVSDELKCLRVLKRLDETHAMDVVPTFMGAHAVPPEFRDDRKGYVDLICRELLPAVKAQGIAEFCDVFCEQGVFSAEEAEQILRAGSRLGLRPKLHADEIVPIGGSQLAGKLGAISAEHLIVCPEEGIRALAQGGTVACCLPATSFYLGAEYAPARAMVQAGVPVAMATDFNPGSCPSLNMQFVINLGCLRYRLTPEEVLTAVTLNGAAALGRAETVGSIEPGKRADLVVWDAPDLDYLCYRVGSNLVRTVVKCGRIVSNRNSIKSSYAF